MARKDTINALVKRGASTEVATLIVATYHTLSAISEAGADALVELGLSEADAADIIEKIGKRSTSTAAKAKKAVEEEEVPQVEMTEVTDFYKYNDDEKKLMAFVEELNEGCQNRDALNLPYPAGPIQLPMKAIVDIASRIGKARQAGKEISDEKWKELLVVANRMYVSHKMDRNESAGVMAAHSIGEPGTQMNMRTFHYAGVANINVTQGLPRLIEIVDARRIPSTPSMQIPLEGIAQRDESVASHVAAEIEITTLLNVADVETDITNMRLVVHPKASEMEQRGITIEEIVNRLSKVKAVRGLVEIDGFDIVISSMGGDGKTAGQEMPSYKKLQVMYDAIKVAKIKGIDGIRRAVLSKDKNTSLWSIVTEGSNLKEVLKIEGVDKRNVMTNSILEVADVLGIEAARNSIIHEAMGTLGEAGLDVDVRHIMLVADLMTNDGSVKAIGRHGVSGKKSSVLARAAFEITAAHLLHAAMVGEVDHLEGVTENIIVGQPVTLGTGAVNLIYKPKQGENEE